MDFSCRLIGCLFLFVWTVGAHEIIFQGSCRGKSVPCQEACIDLEDGTYECACMYGNVLQPDGYNCESAASHIKIQSPEPAQNQEKIPPSQSTPVEVFKGQSESFKPTQIQDKFISFLSDAYQPLKFGSKSFLSFSVPDSAYLETNISLELKISAQNQTGILFYGGQRYGRDFLAISLELGNVVLRFDCGEGTAEEIVSGPLEAEIWHSLNISRKYCSFSEIDVDDPKKTLIDHPSLRSYKGISMAPLVYLGGVPEKLWKTVETKLSHRNSFKGCFRKLLINGEILFDVSRHVNTAKELSNIEMCEKQTIIQNDAPYEWQKNVVFERPVLKLHKKSTKARIDIKSPHFSANSFIKHKASQSLENYLSLEFHVKPTHSDGLIFYAGNSELETYEAVFMINSFVYFQFNLGEGASLLRSELPILLRSWHKVEAWRSGRGGLLKVDGQPWIEGSSPGAFSRMPKSRFMYFGGAPVDKLPTSLQIPYNEGLQGCMKKIFVNDKSIKSRSAESMSNVRECNANPCEPSPCNSGNCSLYRDDFLCLCSYPATGSLCDKMLSGSLGAIGFDRDGYLEFKQKEVMKYITGEVLNISIRFKLTEPYSSGSKDEEQILLFTGKEAKGGDFFTVSVTPQRKVKATVDLGSGPVSLVHDSSFVQYGQWHTISVRRSGRRLTVLFDNHVPETTVTPPGSLQLNVYDSLFIGGYNLRHEIFSKAGIKGCISEVIIGKNIIIDHVKQASIAVNVHECKNAY